MYKAARCMNELIKLKEEMHIHLQRTGKRLENAPEGSLRISSKWNKQQYYHKTDSDNPRGKYITVKDRPLAARLAQKDYDTKLLKVLNEQQKAIERFLNDFDPEAAEQVYKKMSEQRKV